MDKKSLLEESKHFCMMPWVHMHIWPNGDSFPCCMAKPDLPLGNSNKNDLKEIWNSKRMRNIRKNMLKDKPSKECKRCYEIEASTSIHTLRKNANLTYPHHWDLVESTNKYGEVDRLNMAYLDIRFSNLCNFRCRSCGPTFSSAWFDDFQKAYGNPGHGKFIRVNERKDFWEEFAPLLNSVEEVYFAGGEALITEEHYRILDYWLEQGKTDVRLRYTTNFSNFRFKQKSILDYWSKFSNVRVAASLDASGERAEYIRKGTDWQQIESNRQDMIEKCPDIYFEITPTISVYNVFHFPDFHRDWVERGLLDLENVRVNPLLLPMHQRTQILPLAIKEKMKAKYEAHFAWIRAYAGEKNISAESILRSLEGIISFTFEADEQSQLPKFIKHTKQFDQIRQESFVQNFPEYRDCIQL